MTRKQYDALVNDLIALKEKHPEVDDFRGEVSCGNIGNFQACTWLKVTIDAPLSVRGSSAHETEGGVLMIDIRHNVTRAISRTGEPMRGRYGDFGWVFLGMPLVMAFDAVRYVVEPVRLFCITAFLSACGLIVYQALSSQGLI